MSRKRRVNLILWPIMILTSGGRLIWELTGHRIAGEAPWIPYLYAFIFVMAVVGFVSIIRHKEES